MKARFTFPKWIDQQNIHPSKAVNVGDVVEVMVLDIDEERRRISTGLKQCKSNPWQQFAETHNKGDRVEGKIKSITDFGIFIGLDGGIDGPFTCLTSPERCRRRSSS